MFEDLQLQIKVKQTRIFIRIFLNTKVKVKTVIKNIVKNFYFRNFLIVTSI